MYNSLPVMNKRNAFNNHITVEKLGGAEGTVDNYHSVIDKNADYGDHERDEEIKLNPLYASRGAKS